MGIETRLNSLVGTIFAYLSIKHFRLNFAQILFENNFILFISNLQIKGTNNKNVMTKIKKQNCRMKRFFLGISKLIKNIGKGNCLKEKLNCVTSQIYFGLLGTIIQRLIRWNL